MSCTIPHDAEGLPESLCRRCHPELNARPADGGSAEEIEMHMEVQQSMAEAAERLEKRQARALKVEIADLEDKLVKMKARNTDKHTIKRLEEAIAQAKNDLLMIS